MCNQAIASNVMSVSIGTGCGNTQDDPCPHIRGLGEGFLEADNQSVLKNHNTGGKCLKSSPKEDWVNKRIGGG